jgi:hypothetical protein
MTPASLVTSKTQTLPASRDNLAVPDSPRRLERDYHVPRIEMVDDGDPNHPDSMVKKLFGRSKAEERVMEAIKIRYSVLPRTIRKKLIVD